MNRRTPYRATELGKYYGMDDSELPWVYVSTEDSGGLFGLEMDNLLTSLDFRNTMLSVSYGKHISRVMHRSGIVKGPEAIEYIESPGDGTSHGATWQHFAELTRGVSSYEGFHKLDDRSLELQLDGLLNMTLEGANRYGAGWLVIHEGLVDARNDVLEGNRWRQDQLYQGLGLMATNFAERESAGIEAQMARLAA